MNMVRDRKIRTALRTNQIARFVIHCGLDYQPLFGKGAHTPPRRYGWTPEDSSVTLNQ